MMSSSVVFMSGVGGCDSYSRRCCIIILWIVQWHADRALNRFSLNTISASQMSNIFCLTNHPAFCFPNSTHFFAWKLSEKRRRRKFISVHLSRSSLKLSTCTDCILSSSVLSSSAKHEVYRILKIIFVGFVSIKYIKQNTHITHLEQSCLEILTIL